MLLSETILAISSPPTSGGPGRRGIIRIAGPAAFAAARSVIPGLPHTAGYHAHLILPLLHPKLKIAAALIFLAPRSFTGDDLIELHLPNSPALLRAVIDQVLNSGGGGKTDIRLANPGEFSARAFFHGKLDLTQAEGIAATIAATSQTELRAASTLRAGALHKEIAHLTDSLANLLALIEAGIDFADEEGIRFIDPAEITAQLTALAAGIHDRLASSLRLERTDAAPAVVFIGQPNVGKSSLINALAAQDRSIVSPIAGTTRDMLSITMRTPDGEIRLIDVPGEEPPTDQLREKMMAARAAALLDADLIIQVTTAQTGFPATDPIDFPAEIILVQNKSDLLSPSQLQPSPTDRHLVSAKTGHNIPQLRAAITNLAFRREPLGPQRIVLNHRHRDLLQQAKTALLTAAAITDTGALSRHPELLAAELRHALDALGQITGHISPDALLTRIFSQFCIGK